MIRIVAILGTVRPGNYTAKALALVQNEVEKHPEFAWEVVDPAKLHLAFPGAGGDAAEVKKLREAVAGATGVIFATPEYHGSFSSLTKPCTSVYWPNMS